MSYKIAINHSDRTNATHVVADAEDISIEDSHLVVMDRTHKVVAIYAPNQWVYASQVDD
ncbi:hypothetical protein ACW9HQ_38025 [Nocardia gipuzkoensis]